MCMKLDISGLFTISLPCCGWDKHLATHHATHQQNTAENPQAGGQTRACSPLASTPSTRATRCRAPLGSVSASAASAAALAAASAV